MTAIHEPNSADEFIQLVKENLSFLVDSNRTVYAKFSSGLAPGPGRGSVTVRFYNLPTPRIEERRGGGAEAENNRMLFMVRGFGMDSSDPAPKVKVEQLVNSIGTMGRRAPNLRAKTGSPYKVALYLANYINGIAEQFQPNYTHE